MIDQAASLAATAFAHPLAILAVIVICTGWALSKRENNTLTMLLSILAISMTQLVLLDASRTNLATQAKLDAILERLGRGELVRAEERPSAQIEEMRR